ncbi:MAG: hypothetical protein K0S70_598 [Microbacterium sp.]|nr:hypothetical protein [Microbacterium sp.]
METMSIDSSLFANGSTPRRTEPTPMMGWPPQISRDDRPRRSHAGREVPSTSEISDRHGSGPCSLGHWLTNSATGTADDAGALRRRGPSRASDCMRSIRAVHLETVSSGRTAPIRRCGSEPCFAFDLAFSEPTTGLEPVTPVLQVRCATNCAKSAEPGIPGFVAVVRRFGGDRARTNPADSLFSTESRVSAARPPPTDFDM